MTEYKDISLHVKNRVGWVDFNRRPRERQGLGHGAGDPRRRAQYQADPVVGVIVLGSALERYFSTGADIAFFKDMSKAQVVYWTDLAHELVRTLRHSEKPLLAAIHGIAVGGGLEMTLHCDLRFAATDARLGQPEVNINYIPPIDATQSLARLIGRPRAIRLLCDG